MPLLDQSVHSPGKSHRFHLLDGLRGIAAILVAAYHVPLPLRPHLSLENGWLAVDFFFCLSGFVIAYSYQGRFNKGMKLKDFVVARLIRLYPLYFIGTLLGLASAILVGTHATKIVFVAGDLVRALPFALLMLPDFGGHAGNYAAFPLNIPGWSLYFEMLANIVFALLLRFRLANSALLSVMVTSAFTVFVIATLRQVSTLNVGWLLASLNLGYVRVTLSFFLGVVVLRLYLRRHKSTGMVAGSIVFPIFVTLGLLVVIGPSFRIFQQPRWQLAVITLAFPAFVYFGARSNVPRALITPCAILGDLSYPIYVLHAPLVLPFGGSQTQVLLQSHGVSLQAFLILLLAGVIVFAWLANRFYDLPVRSWLSGRYKTRGRSSKAEATRAVALR